MAQRSAGTPTNGVVAPSRATLKAPPAVQTIQPPPEAATSAVAGAANRASIAERTRVPSRSPGVASKAGA